jgi:hypothetical protein
VNISGVPDAVSIRDGCLPFLWTRHLRDGIGQMTGRQMSIAQHHGGVRMTEKLANRIQRNARLHQAARKVMAQIMEAKILQVGPLSQFSPRPIRPFQSATSDTRKDSPLVFLRKLAPSVERRVRLAIQRDAACLRLGVD